MEKQRNITTGSIVTDEERAVKSAPSKEIKVVVHIPKHLHERVRQQKINKIYDILNPELSH